MNNKIIIILALLVFSFINNAIIAFDYLKDIASEVEPVVFYHKVEPRVEIEKPVKKYIKTIYKYSVYFIFFFDIDNLPSVVETLNYT